MDNFQHSLAYGFYPGWYLKSLTCAKHHTEKPSLSNGRGSWVVGVGVGKSVGVGND